MKTLLKIQQPYYETLLGFPTPAGVRSGARRAWIDMPVGSGKGVVVAAATETLAALGATRRVLYVTHACMVHTAERELAWGDTRVMGKNPREQPAFEGVTICTERQWCLGHDTWVKYGGYDLIIIDMWKPPIYGSKTREAAMRTTLSLDSVKIWIVGGGV